MKQQIKTKNTWNKTQEKQQTWKYVNEKPKEATRETTNENKNTWNKTQETQQTWTYINEKPKETTHETTN